MTTTSNAFEDHLKPGTERPTEAELAASEERLGHVYPPSFRQLLGTLGLFTSERPDGNTVFTVWPLEEHQTALARAAEELECDATIEDVAEELGIEAQTIAALEQVVLIGCENDEDFVGFDLRTQSVETGEAAFVLQLMDDVEIEYLAANPGQKQAAGFGVWLRDHVKRTTA